MNDDDGESVRYILIVELAPSSDRNRLVNVVPDVIKVIDRFSGGEKEIAFRSSDGLLFAHFFRTRAHHRTVSKALTDVLTHAKDGYLMFEAGDVRLGTSGFTRAWTWLQHH